MSARDRIIKMAEELPKGPIHYAQIRPHGKMYSRQPWYSIDCSGSPAGQRYLNFFFWYHARRGQA